MSDNPKSNWENMWEKQTGLLMIIIYSYTICKFIYIYIAKAIFFDMGCP